MTIPFRSLTPFAHVRSVPDSIAFYQRLGFTLGNTFQPPDADQPAWAWLHCGQAELMVGLGSESVVAWQQAVLFYLYVDDVAAKHAELAAAGLEVGPITYPFYAQRGEFRMTDPDGYVLMITHT